MLIDYQNLDAKLPDLKKTMAEADPFPHVIIDGLLKPGHVKEINDGFDKALEHKNPYSPKKHKHVKAKLGTPNQILMTKIQRDFFEEINSESFLGYLSRITGIENIYADPDLNGGGLHQISRDGFLNVHTDFNYHPKTRKHRRLNLIFYLNETWSYDWAGNLQLWDKDVQNCVVEVEPLANRAVLFETSEISFHGHPDPLKCPQDVTRRSCAVYYYSEWPEGLELREKTNYVLTPNQVAALADDLRNFLTQNPNASENEASVGLPDWQPRDVVKHYRELRKAKR